MTMTTEPQVSQLSFRTTPEFLELLDQWRREVRRSKIPSRSAAVHELVRWALENQPKPKKR